MALTPEDVVNKRFQPTKFREGYDQDEVDDFLDEVVVELRRLGQENEELRQQLTASESRVSELQRSGGSTPATASAPQPAAEPEPTPEPEPEPTPEPEPVAAAPAVTPPTPSYAAPSGESETASTNNLLQLARRLHEEHVKEGVEKRDALIAEGRDAAARLTSDAEVEQRRITTDAEAQQRAQLAQFEQERATLQTRIDELRTFEREYRQKLKGYIEGQLRELDTAGDPSGQSVDASSSAGYQGVGGN